MKKHNSKAVVCFLFVFLPLSLLAQGSVSGELKNVPTHYFSLSIRDIPAVQPIPSRAFFRDPISTIPPAPEIFTFKSLKRDFMKDAGQIWSYPIHIRAGDILPIVGFAVLTGVLINNDEEIRRDLWDYRMSHPWVKALSPVVTEMGSAGAWGTAAAFLLIGMISHNDKTVETGVLATTAMMQSGILVTFLKGLFGRQRPSWDQGVDRWSGPVGFFKRFESGQYGRYDSFPGGHAITAWSLGTVVAMQYKESVWVPIVAYTIATGVALSRVTEYKHWLSDCLVGGIMGHYIGRMVVLNHRRRYNVLPTAGLAHGSLSFALTVSSR